MDDNANGASVKAILVSKARDKDVGLEHAQDYVLEGQGEGNPGVKIGRNSVHGRGNGLIDICHRNESWLWGSDDAVAARRQAEAAWLGSNDREEAVFNSIKATGATDGYNTVLADNWQAALELAVSSISATVTILATNVLSTSLTKARKVGRLVA